MSERLLVLLNGIIVGTLDRPDSTENPTFTYLPEYVQEGRVALSARLPLSTSTYPSGRVAPFLAGLLPENPDTRERWARSLGTHPDDPFTLLSRMGWDCPGAVQFCLPSDVDTLLSREPTYEPLDDSALAARLRALSQDPASWSMPEEHWSLGGQQEKFALAHINGQWLEARGAAATTHIVKPGIRRLLHQALVEHATMAAVSSLGIDVARSRLIQFEDQWALVVERFDRFTTDDGVVVRIHQEDFCQALGRLPERKYEAKGGPTLADLVRTVNQQSLNREDDLRALADFLIVNVVAGAPDGHSKNISMIRSPGENWVAPLYDLATGLTYESQQIDRTVAVSVGGERSFSRIYREEWRKAAETLGLPGAAVLGRVSSLAQEFPAAFEAALSEAGDTPGAGDVAERALPALHAHCQGILDRL